MGIINQDDDDFLLESIKEQNNIEDKLIKGELPQNIQDELNQHNNNFRMNMDTRLACILMLDCSYSMGTLIKTPNGEVSTRLRELIRGIHQLKEEVCSDKATAERIQIAYVTYGANVSYTDFVPINDLPLPKIPTMDLKNNKCTYYDKEFSPDNGTPMGQALLISLNNLQKQRNIYRANNISYYIPYLFNITDGFPNDLEIFNKAIPIVKAETVIKPINSDKGSVKSKSRLNLFSFIIADSNEAEYNTSVENMRKISNNVLKLENNNFSSLISFISASFDARLKTPPDKTIQVNLKKDINVVSFD